MRAESKLQKDVRLVLAAGGYRSVACSNGAVLAGGKRARAIQMSVLKVLGLTVGYPDLIVYGSDRRIGHLEIKLEGEPLDPDQVKVHSWLKAWGFNVAVCRSVEDVPEILVSWGWQ